MAERASDQIALMARYHHWATKRLLAAIATMPDDMYLKPCGLYFGSVHGTLNHLLLTDSGIWYARLTGTPTIAAPLDAELEGDRASLASRLLAATARWPDYIDSLDDKALAGDLHYVMTTGQERVLPVTAVLLHVFNHATHHRGQITAALTTLGFDYEPLDLPYMLFAEMAQA